MTHQTTFRLLRGVRAPSAQLVVLALLFSVAAPLGAGAQQAQKQARAAAIITSTADKGEQPYYSGDVFARAQSDAYSLTVPLGMSKGGVILVQFPADDPVYTFHEGNARLAYVNCGQEAGGASNGQREQQTDGQRKCAMRPTDALVFQPGEDFVAGKPGAATTTVITVQRASGMVVSFPLYLVGDATQNANNVIISYDVKNVMTVRRKAGLLSPLASPEDIAQDGRVPATSPLLAPDDGSVGEQGTQGTPPPVKHGARKAQPQPTPPAPTPEEVLRDRTVAELQRVAAQDAVPAFGKPVHGLALALLGGEPPVSETAIQVIAVRNTLSVPVRLLPDQPDIRIMQAAKKGDAILEQVVPVMHVATTVGDDNVLKPGEVYYFAVAYETPALGVRQSLCASFAHMMASDAPAVVFLTTQLAAR